MLDNIKLLLKEYLPENCSDHLVNIYRRSINIRGFRKDKQRFLKHYSKGFKTETKDHLDARLIFHSHSIEKGLSHRDLRLGFGKNALKAISKALARYEENQFSKASDAYLNTMSVLNAYINIHEESGFNLTYLRNILGCTVFDEAVETKSTLGGTSQFTLEDKANNHSKTFKDLFIGRQSIREYGTDPVSESKIDNALSIALKCPSICNRQSARVIRLQDSKKIISALSIQDGLSGYPTPPMLLIVLTDTRAFVGINERNQPYVDGGLFAMSLLLSLEYVGLATCSLNTMFRPKQDIAFRELLDIKEYENIIMMISCGNYPQMGYVPKSFRYANSKIMRTS